MSTFMKVNCTSALVNGAPSCHVTPLRRLKVIDLPSSLTCHDSARAGCASVSLL